MLISLLLLLMPSFALAYSGVSPVEFLDNGFDARSAVFGPAFTGVADDASAIYWNPAGLSSIKYREVSATYSDLFGNGVDYSVLGIAGRIKNFGAGLSIINQSIENIKGYADISGNPTGVFSARSSALYASLSMPVLNRNLSAGVNLKIINQYMYKFYANSAGLDIGLKYSLPRVNAGINLVNILSLPVMYNRDTPTRETVPPDLLAGISVLPLQNLIIGAGISKNLKYNKISFSCAAELNLKNFLRIRAGVVDSEILAGLSFSILRYSIHYVYYYSSGKYALGNSHRFSVSGRL